MGRLRRCLAATVAALTCASLVGCSSDGAEDGRNASPDRVTAQELQKRVDLLVEEHPNLINCGLYFEEDVLHADVVGSDKMDENELEGEIAGLLNVPIEQVQVVATYGYCGDT